MDKALYGAIEAARLWYETMTGKPREDGFAANEYDDIDDDDDVGVCVDALMCWAPSRTACELATSTASAVGHRPKLLYLLLTSTTHGLQKSARTSDCAL